MKTYFQFILSIALLFSMATNLMAQNNGDYRSVATGNWSALATWEQYNSGTSTWSTPTALPVYNDGFAITIRNGHTVTYDAGVTGNAAYVKRCTVDSGATLILPTTMWLYDDGGGIPCLTINGTFTNNYQFKFHEATDMVVIGNSGVINCKYGMGSGIIGSGSFTSSGYMKIIGNGTLTLPVATGTTIIPIGTAAAYAPVTITPDAASSFSFNVVSDTTGSNSGANRVPLKWTITTTASYTPVFQWPGSIEGANFSANRSSYAQLYNVTLWASAAGTLAGSDPYTFTSSGLLGGTASYAIGNGILALGGTITGPVTSANWLLRVDSTNAAPITTGSISALSQTIQGLTIQSYTGTTQTAPGITTNVTNTQRMYPTSGTLGYWPADSAAGYTSAVQNPARFVQYVAAPLSGTSFYIDKISMCLGDNIGNFKTQANIYYYVGTDTTGFLSKATKVNSSSQYSIGSSTVYQSPVFSLPSAVTVPSGSNFYLRVYPYYSVGAASGKYWEISNVTLSGLTNPTIAAVVPTVQTTNASSLSTTFFTTGGKVWADGGGSITARGVCWDTTTGATISGNHTTDSTGTGAFTSSITGLTAGKPYFVRSYATNSAGTSYGNEITVTTYLAIVVPTVTTTAVSSIAVHTALSGGAVTDWGGADVTAKGLCWSTSANPTLSDSYTVDGTGIATFTRSMSGLSGTTAYHVRAYATNSAGTGYGTDLPFTTATPSKDSTVIVAKDGSGNYTRVCDALRNVPANYTGKWTIFVKKGIYFERDTVLATSYNVNLVGEDRDSTVITNWIYSDYISSGNPGTNGTYTFLVLGFDFVAKNITLQNTYWPNRWGTISGTQAVAVLTNGGDRHEFVNCAFRGYQDTYYAGGSSATAYGRAYFKNCLITGTVDYIFGRGVCVFDSCTTLTMSNAGTSITAPSAESTAKYGLVFRNCTLTADTGTYTDSCGYAHVPVTTMYLGRPWQGSPRSVFIHCDEPAVLANAGWTVMSTTPTLFAEYNCIGAGATTTRATVADWPTANQARQLTSAEAATYSLATIYAKNSSSSTNITFDWMPTNATANDNLPFVITGVDRIASNLVPNKMTIGNYPNPFNPTTNIQFTVAASGRATVKIYNILGQEVANVFEGQAIAGQSYKVTFNGARVASGVYFCSIESNGNRLVSKMLLLK